MKKNTYPSKMTDEFYSHNLFWKDKKRFFREDPHLSYLNELKYVHPLDWWQKINWKEAGIYLLTGGRQIGKSTSLKLLIKNLLETKIFNPDKIFYLPCDLVFDQQHLLRLINSFFDQVGRQPFLLLIDEITYTPHWDRVIKSLADAGKFRKGFCVITGSDSMILKEASSSFPGRRGSAAVTDFHLHPLSFHDYCTMVAPSIIKNPADKIEKIFDLFEDYLKCGGFLRAINDLGKKGQISDATYLTFEQWIRGDFIKRGKNEQNLLHVLKNIMEVGVTQNSYTGLAQRTGMMSKETFIDYVNLLERMDVLFTLKSFDQNTLRGFPKKNMKFHFCDPFIRHTIERWLVRERMFSGTTSTADLVEATTAAQFNRFLPSYYIKATGEVDLVIVIDKNFLPIEIKWTNQSRPNDLKQLQKFKKALLLAKNIEKIKSGNIQIYPLPLFLLEYHSSEKLKVFIKT